MVADSKELYAVLDGCSDFELEEVCLALHEPYNRLAGDSPAARALSLVKSLDTQARLGELEGELRKRFPRRFEPVPASTAGAPAEAFDIDWKAIAVLAAVASTGLGAVVLSDRDSRFFWGV